MRDLSRRPWYTGPFQGVSHFWGNIRKAGTSIHTGREWELAELSGCSDSSVHAHYSLKGGGHCKLIYATGLMYSEIGLIYAADSRHILHLTDAKGII